MTLDALQLAVGKCVKFLETELQSIRTGRANPSLIEDLRVACYDSHSPLQQVASISAPEPQTLVVQPWDPAIIKDIERAISQSSLGINPVVDGKIIRLPFPPMTEERRQELTKVVKGHGEQAKVAVRSAREETVKDLRQSQRESVISEDALEVALKKVQEQIDAANKQIDLAVERKSIELQQI